MYNLNRRATREWQMQSVSVQKREQNSGRTVQPPDMCIGMEVDAEFGMLLSDSSMSYMGWDRGAMRILCGTDETADSVSLLPQVPKAIVERIRSVGSEKAIDEMVVQIGSRSYLCRFFVLTTTDRNGSQPVVVVYLRAADTLQDPAVRIGETYRLTEREREALRGIALGLTTKELAHRMQISPNTVKSFIRLITVKLGVGSRAEIMVKLLERRNGDQL